MTSTVSSGYEPNAARSYPNCEGSVAPQVDRTRYVLSEEGNERIFREAIVPQTLTGTSQNQPVVVFVAGQTGAGKTAVTSLVDHALAQAGQAVNINLDTYKPYHPRYDELSVADDTAVGAYTSIDGHTRFRPHGLLAILEATNDFDSRFVVIEAIPPNEQDGPDQNFWSVYDNEWPPAESPVPVCLFRQRRHAGQTCGQPADQR